MRDLFLNVASGEDLTRRQAGALAAVMEQGRLAAAGALARYQRLDDDAPTTRVM